MSKSLFWLSDGAWAAIEPHLPRGKPGKPRVDDRRVICGILHVFKTGCRWRNVSPPYGPPTTIYIRYIARRSAVSGSGSSRRWQRSLQCLKSITSIPSRQSTSLG